jgi:hypothetical protein
MARASVSERGGQPVRAEFVLLNVSTAIASAVALRLIDESSGLGLGDGEELAAPLERSWTSGAAYPGKPSKKLGRAQTEDGDRY